MALILLPPSESKYRPGAGSPLDLSTRPEPLIEPTRQVLAALVGLCRGDPVAAAAVLGLNENLFPLVEANAELESAPTAAARRIYTGVVFDALDAKSMTSSERRRVDRDVWVTSALFGVVRLGERIPAYRLTAGTGLPGLNPLSTIWRPALDCCWRSAETCEAAALQALTQAASFADCCTLIAESGVPEPAQTAAGFLHRWIAAGLLANGHDKD